MDVAAQPGRGIGRDIGRAVERELDAFISRRHEQRVKTEGERQIEEAWRESVRAYEEKRRQVAASSGALFIAGRPNATAPPYKR